MTANECKKRYDADPTLLTALRLSYEKWRDGVRMGLTECTGSLLFTDATCGLCHHYATRLGHIDCANWYLRYLGTIGECPLYVEGARFDCCYLFDKIVNAYNRSDRPAFQYWARKLRDKLHRLWREEKARVRKEAPNDR